MITNLLSNAMKFTPEGGEVRMPLRPCTPQFVEIVVEDTGRGIPTEHLPHIFDRFYRVPGSGTAPAPEQGLGLGLSFVAWIVKAHNGKIEVESTPGKGTRFTIRLPTKASAPTPWSWPAAWHKVGGAGNLACSRLFRRLFRGIRECRFPGIKLVFRPNSIPDPNYLFVLGFPGTTGTKS